jgi:hypothetical protein
MAYDLREVGEGANEVGSCEWMEDDGGAAEVKTAGLSTPPNASEREGNDCLGLVISLSCSLVRRDAGGETLMFDPVHVFVGGAP